MVVIERDAVGEAETGDARISTRGFWYLLLCDERRFDGWMGRMVIFFCQARGKDPVGTDSCTNSIQRLCHLHGCIMCLFKRKKEREGGGHRLDAGLTARTKRQIAYPGRQVSAVASNRRE